MRERQKIGQLGKILKLEKQKMDQLVAKLNQHILLVNQNSVRLQRLRDSLETQFSSDSAGPNSVWSLSQNSTFLQRIQSNILTTESERTDLNQKLDQCRQALGNQRSRVKAVEEMIMLAKRQLDQRLTQAEELELNDTVINKLFEVES
ncbi:MAG: hypothetical protein AAGA30_11745 [Planctomycetota bacterium]